MMITFTTFKVGVFAFAVVTGRTKGGRIGVIAGAAGALAKPGRTTFRHDAPVSRVGWLADRFSCAVCCA